MGIRGEAGSRKLNVTLKSAKLFVPEELVFSSQPLSVVGGEKTIRAF